MTDRHRRNTRQRDRRQSEKGQIVPLTALMIVPLMILAAFAIDIGSWYVRASELQSAADLASLAGAQVRGEGGTDAEVEAAVDQVLAANGIDPAGIAIDIDLAIPNDVTVRLRDDDVDLYLATLVTDDVAIGRDSTATYGGCLGSCNQPIRIDPPITDMPSLSEGDGFEPLIVANNSKVFTLNHHVDSTARATSNGYADLRQLMCVDISTKGACPGYPIKLDTVTADATRLVYYQAREEVWYPIQRPNYTSLVPPTGTTDWGLGCIEIATAASCGEVIFTTYPTVASDIPVWGAFPRDFRFWGTQPEKVGNRVFMVDADGIVHCYDLASNGLCSGYPATTTDWTATVAFRGVGQMGHTNQPLEPNALVSNQRLFIAWPTGVDIRLLCWSLTTNSACPGFGAQVISVGYEWSPRLFESLNGSGNVNGVCVYGGPDDIICRSLDGSSSFTRNDLDGGFPSKNDVGGFCIGGSARCLSWPYRWDNRLYVPAIVGDSVDCVDLVTGTPCGRISGDNTRPYAVTRIPGTSCLMGLGDAGRFFVFNRDMQPCPSGSGNMRLMPCSCDDGTFYWGLVLFDREFLDRFDSFVVTARNQAGVIVAGPIDMVTNGGRFDLSGLSPSTPWVDLDFQASIPSGDQWINPIVGEVTVTERPALRN